MSRKRSRPFSRRSPRPWLRSPPTAAHLRRRSPLPAAPAYAASAAENAAPAAALRGSAPASRASMTAAQPSPPAACRRSGSPPSPCGAYLHPPGASRRAAAPLGVGTAAGPQLQPQWRVVRHGDSGGLTRCRHLPTGGTTHFSPWSYDRHVPLGFFGAPFTPGIYHGRVQPVDLAATLASLLGVDAALGIGG